MKKDLISVIIPVWRPNNNHLKCCINSVINQTYTNLEIILIYRSDPEFDNNFRGLMKEYSDKRIKIIESLQKGVAFGRNLGIKNSTGEFLANIDSDDYCIENRFERQIKVMKSKKCNFLAFIDSDCIANNSWIRTVIDELKPSCGISGPIKNGNPESLVAWSEYFLEFVKFNEYKKRSSISFLPGCNAACTKEDYQRVGGFVEFESSEDILLGKALRNSGVNLYFIPEMTIEHLCRTELNKVMKNLKKRGKFFVITGRKEPSLPHSYLIKSRWKIPIIFFGRTYLSIIRSINAKKFSKFFLAFPLILLGISSLCRGIWDETGKMNPEKKS